MKANVSPSGEENRIFSVFISAILCSMLGLFSKADPWPNPQEHSKSPKPDVKPTWAATGSPQELGDILGGFQKLLKKTP